MPKAKKTASRRAPAKKKAPLKARPPSQWLKLCKAVFKAKRKTNPDYKWSACLKKCRGPYKKLKAKQLTMAQAVAACT